MPEELFHRYENVTDPRLGRHIHIDPRSKAYRVVPWMRDLLNSVRYTSHVPTFNQGQIGSCTGNAAAKALSYDPFWPEGETVLGKSARKDETFAVGVYSDATKVDGAPGEYPPDDTGSSGLAAAKVLHHRGLIAGYRHAHTLDEVLSALQSGPVIAGVDWLQDMFTPAADGALTVTGAIAGGHEFVLDEIDIENERIWMQNSWGSKWGVHGRAYFTFTDFTALLHAHGDVIAFEPITAPA